MGKHLKFKFHVDANGKFTYEKHIDPATGEQFSNWPYTHRDTIEYHCDKGPFTLLQRATDQAVAGLDDPFGGQVKAAQTAAGTWVATPVFDDKLTQEQRKAIWEEFGFVANYRYVIGVSNGTSIAVDDNQSGIHSC